MPRNRVSIACYGPEIRPLSPGDRPVHDGAHLGRFSAVEKKSGSRDELQRIPFDGIVTRGNRQASRCVMVLDCELDRRCWRHPDIDHIAANRLECSVNDRLEHGARDAAVASHYYARFSSGTTFRPGAEACGEFRDYLRRERLADSPAHTRDAHHQSLVRHSTLRLDPVEHNYTSQATRSKGRCYSMLISLVTFSCGLRTEDPCGLRTNSHRRLATN